MKYACCKSMAGSAADGLSCSKCGLKFHYSCLNPGGAKRTTIQDRINWICPDCKLTLPRQINNDNTPIRGHTSKSSCSENITLRRGGSTCDMDTSCQSEDTSFLDQVRFIIASEISILRTEIKSSIAPLLNDLKCLREEVSSIKDSLDFVNNKFEDLNKRVDNCEIEIKHMSVQCSDLNSFKYKMDAVEIENNKREQWSRRSNVEIYGIPEKKSENLNTIIQSLADKADFNLNVNTDIDFVTRVAAKDKSVKKNKPIIVKFLCRWKKDEFLSRIRKLKLKCHDIGFMSNNNTSIYFNDHLTSSNKLLLQLVKKAAKEKFYKYVWVKNCSIMVRRNDTSPVLHIINSNDLKKIA